MPKTSSKWVCQECGHTSLSYLGKCPECSSWGSLIEEIVHKKSSKSATLNETENNFSSISDIDLSNIERIKSFVWIFFPVYSDADARIFLLYGECVGNFFQR